MQLTSRRQRPPHLLRTQRRSPGPAVPLGMAACMIAMLVVLAAATL